MYLLLLLFYENHSPSCCISFSVSHHSHHHRTSSRCPSCELSDVAHRIALAIVTSCTFAYRPPTSHCTPAHRPHPSLFPLPFAHNISPPSPLSPSLGTNRVVFPQACIAAPFLWAQITSPLPSPQVCIVLHLNC